MKKGIIKLFAAVVMLSAMIFAVPAANAEGEIAIPDSDLTYTLVDGTLTISGTGDMPDWSFAGAPWYDSRDSITAVVIEEGVTSIGGRAFYSCDGLESITIPTSVTSIGDWAFYSCDGLESITIPASVTSIGDSAFAQL